MKTLRTLEQPEYIETPRRCTSPTKIDEILEARLQAFLRARRVKRFTFVR